METVRLPADTLSADTMKAMDTLDRASRRNHLDPQLQELVRARASQINGCSYCVDLHSTDALTAGVPARKLNALTVWRHTPFFSPQERAALELTEAMTRLADDTVGDELWARVREHFDEQDLSDLVWLVAVINTWNRIGATTHCWAPSAAAPSSPSS